MPRCTPALVLGTGIVSLAVLRHLAAARVRRIVYLSPKNFDRTWFTRFSSEKFRVPSPDTDPEALLEFLMDPRRPWQGAVLIATVDPCVRFVSQHSGVLSTRFRTSILPWPQLEQIMKKRYLYEQAQAAGVATPEVLFPESMKSLDKLAGKIRFPCILKPYETPDFFAAYRRKAIVVENARELKAGFLDACHRGIQVMVSEIIPGEASNIITYRSYIDSKGALSAEMMTRKVRQHPPEFGVGHVQRSVAMDPYIRNQALRLLHKVHFRGFSSVEFKLDRRDGIHKLMEINTRAVLCQQLLQKAGINFMELIYMDLIEDTRTRVSGYRTDVFFFHRFFDLQEFSRIQKTSRKPGREFLKPYFQKQKVFAIPFLDDPLPFLVSAWIMFKGFLKIRVQRLGKRRKPAVLK